MLWWYFFLAVVAVAALAAAVIALQTARRAPGPVRRARRGGRS